MTEETRVAYEALTDEQKRIGWDAFHGLSTHKWTLYQCSDCDPAFLDDSDDEEHPARGETEPYRIICMAGGDNRPEHCPRCGSYLSLLDQVEVFPSTRPR